jgi:hypothetical protein
MAKTDVEKIDEAVDAAKAPGTFSILNVLEERAYPREEVVVYLDEQTAYEASQLQEKIDELNKSKSLDVQSEIDFLISERDKAIEKLEKQKYVFTIVGISEGLREDLMNEAAKDFPLEYEEHKNPITGEKTREEIENKDRDRIFTNSLWHNQIEKIEASDGSIQDKVTVKDVEELRRKLPIAAIGSINQSIERLRISTAVFMMSVNEDFLARS